MRGGDGLTDGVVSLWVLGGMLIAGLVFGWIMAERRAKRLAVERLNPIPDASMDEVAEVFLRAVRKIAPNHGVFVSPPWSEHVTTDFQAVQLTKWLVTHGQIDVPENYNTPIADSLNKPREIAMTHNSYSRLAPNGGDTNVYGPFFGVTQVGNRNRQVISGDVNVDVEETISLLRQLAEALRGNAALAPEDIRGSLERAAKAVDEHVQSGDVSSDKVHGTLRWIGGFATAVGAGVLTAPVITALKALGVPGL
jgi:hypothetical protein